MVSVIIKLARPVLHRTSRPYQDKRTLSINIWLYHDVLEHEYIKKLPLQNDKEKFEESSENCESLCG